MLDQNHFEQYDRIHTGPSVIFAVQRRYHFIDVVKIHRRVYLPQQMRRRDKTFRVYDFHYPTIQFSPFQHFSSPQTILSHEREKAQH